MFRRRIRTQREWKVEISGRGADFFDAGLPLPANNATARARISAAAFLVNVTARIRSGLTPCRISAAMRYVTTRVLPVPAPASTSSGPASVRTAAHWAGFSGGGGGGGGGPRR